MPYDVFALGDFRGGLNVDAAPENVADNELTQADNCVLDVRGAIRKRKGATKVNATSVNAQVTQLIEWQRASGETVLLAVTDANGDCNLHTVDNVGVFKQLCSVARNKIGWFSLQDYFYFVDGNEFYEWDGINELSLVPHVRPVEPDEAGDNDLAPIRKCRWLAWHPRNMRIYAAGNPDAADTLYYSEPNDPTYWKSSSRLVPTGGDGAVTALKMFAHALLVFYSDSVWSWKGIDPTPLTGDATWTRVPAPYGTLSPDTICLTPNSLTWLARGEIVSLNPALLDYNLVMLPGGELISALSANRVSTITRAIVQPDTACAVYDAQKGRYLLAYPDSTASAHNTHVLALDWNLQAFTRFTGWQVNCWCNRKGGGLIFGSGNYILETDGATYTDINTETGAEKPIGMVIATKRTYLENPFVMKRLHKMLIAGEAGDAVSSSLDATVRSIGYGERAFPGVSFSPIGMKWGDPWGTPWAAPDLRAVEVRVKLKGDRFQVEFQNDTPGEGVSLQAVVFQFRTDRKLKGVKYSETG
jgi:hypothetical protein